MSEHRPVAPQSNQPWGCDQVRDELGAWALGALAPEEATLVEQHLAVCEACRQEATALSGVARLLPFTLAPVSPSRAAKHALMSRIADEQLAAAAPPPRPSRPANRSAVPGKGAGRFHWSQLLVAPLALALLVMTLWSFELRGQVDNSEGSGERDRAAMMSMLPEGFQTYSMHSDCEKCQATGTMLANPDQARALMVAWNLDPSQIHQVWCQSEGSKPVLVASLDVSDAGEVVQPLVFEQPIAGYSRIFVVSHDGEISEVRMNQNGSPTSTPVPLPRQ